MRKNMQTNEILAALDKQILNLKQARAILVGSRATGASKAARSPKGIWRKSCDR
jgi:hypothetical protein